MEGAGAYPRCFINLLGSGYVLCPDVRVIDAPGQYSRERARPAALDLLPPGFLPGLVHGSSGVHAPRD
ncbi:MAG TPA: hypothetical protein VMV92_33900 [Streptosporangiaceae bacterium]|nr:hypothetical protein [Streptosporangiaceae bacterium]